MAKRFAQRRMASVQCRIGYRIAWRHIVQDEKVSDFFAARAAVSGTTGPSGLNWLHFVARYIRTNDRHLSFFS
jgi:hypothetical protein